MADDSKKGLNVNANVFVPNVGAAAFVPGRATHPVPPAEGAPTAVSDDQGRSAIFW